MLHLHQYSWLLAGNLPAVCLAQWQSMQYALDYVDYHFLLPLVILFQIDY